MILSPLTLFHDTYIQCFPHHCARESRSVGSTTPNPYSNLDTRTVATEISAINNPSDPAAHWLATHSSLIHPSTPLSPFLMAWDLGAGESAVISLSEQIPNSMVALDDLAARRCAQALGLYVTGTIGLVLMAKRAGLIPSATEALNAITSAGLYISQHHLHSIRRQAGE